MKWILDACTLIYLVKAQLFNQFMDLVEVPVVIDSSVYDEVIIQGKKNKYPDAFKTEKLLNQYQIPIISVDVASDIHLFTDPGETSCYIIAKQEGICLTSDDRAYKKFLLEELKVMRVDSFYFEMLNQNRITEAEFISILKKLENFSATKPKSIVFFMEKLYQRRRVKNND